MQEEPRGFWRDHRSTGLSFPSCYPSSVYYYHSVRFHFPFGFTVSRVNRNPSIPPPHFWYQHQVLPLNLTTAYYVNGRSNARHYVLAYWYVTDGPEQPPALLSCFADHKVMERVMGIEPTCSAWKADVLPLNYTRIFEPDASIPKSRNPRIYGVLPKPKQGATYCSRLYHVFVFGLHLSKSG